MTFTTEERLTQLERHLSRLRRLCAFLALMLIATFMLAAAPSAEGKLTATEIVLRDGKDSVIITPRGLTLTGADGPSSKLTASALVIEQGELEVRNQIGGAGDAVMGVALKRRSNRPSLAELRLDSRSQIPWPQVTVQSQGGAHFMAFDGFTKHGAKE